MTTSSVPLLPGVIFTDHRTDAIELAAQARAAGHSVHRVDVGAEPTREAVLDGSARALAFPKWSGRNWDALSDSLNDLSWLPATRRVLIVRGFAALRNASSAGNEAETFVEILARAACRWADTETPLCVIVVP